MITIQAPDVGSIVGCWFPFDCNNLTKPIPGPDFRPCLVLQVIKRIDKCTVDLLVCYGTGQTTDSNKISMSFSSIEIEKGQHNRLAETTKFDLKKFAILPFESCFFSPPGQPDVPFAKVGRLSENEERKVVAILSKPNVSLNYQSQSKVCLVERRSSRK